MLTKDWDRHVTAAEEVARGRGFQDLRDYILDRLPLEIAGDAVDVGSGTGLLTLPLAARCKRVWAIDVAPRMTDYLRAKAASAGLDNIEVAVASAVSLPLVDGSADVVVSNYCFHHLSDADKLRALREAHRVLRPGGRLVLGDMMFRPALSDPRDRQVMASKVRAMLRKGPAGVARLAKNGLRLATACWEKPARPDWWEEALRDAGFAGVLVEPLPHEGGIASGEKES